jgi:hypothetical protein
MPSKSSADYLERKRVFLPPTAGKGLFVTNSLRSHSRPVSPLPELLQEDTPARRVLTQEEKDRIAYTSHLKGILDDDN